MNMPVVADFDHLDIAAEPPQPKSITVAFFGGEMEGLTLALPYNHFADGDTLIFRGNEYLMKGTHAYHISHQI